MKQSKKLPTACPSCQGGLSIRSLHCAACDTTISGDYDLPALMRLQQEEQQFVLEFVKSSGSLKEMARKMELSYPTVRNKLDDIIASLKTFERHETTD